MNGLKIFCALALASFALPAHAALWSVSNEVTRVGNKAVLTVSFTGDTVAHGAQADVTIPFGFSVVSASALHGGACAVLPNPTPSVHRDIVRVSTIAMFGALPARIEPVCQVSAVANGGYSGWFRLAADLCYDGAAQPYVCELDPGFVTVVP